MPDNNLLLEVNHLETHFFMREGIVRAVDGVSFTVERGRTLGVLGESGCGKSVTGFSILRLVRSPGKIVSGEILLHKDSANGDQVMNLVTLPPNGEEIRQIRGADIAMVFQEPMTSLDPVYTVGDQIMEAIIYHQQVSKREARERAIEILRRVNMPNPEQIVDRYPHQLSGGMRQRAMIAMALSCRPRLLIADEPTTALDVTTEAQILELMNELKREMNMSMLFITHNLGVIAEMADDVLVMYLGKVVEQADVRALFHEPKHPYTRALLQSIPKIGRKSQARLQSIEGMVPPAHSLPSGCPFHPRCPAFMPGVCDVARPELCETGGGHRVSCFLYEQVDTVSVPEPAPSYRRNA
ncbi:MAG: ABC transporter ATP-binding protein [Caldilineaceae bacterium]